MIFSPSSHLCQLHFFVVKMRVTKTSVFVHITLEVGSSQSILGDNLLPPSPYVRYTISKVNEKTNRWRVANEPLFICILNFFYYSSRSCCSYLCSVPFIKWQLVNMINVVFWGSRKQRIFHHFRGELMCTKHICYAINLIFCVWRFGVVIWKLISISLLHFNYFTSVHTNFSRNLITRLRGSHQKPPTKLSQLGRMYARILVRRAIYNNKCDHVHRFRHKKKGKWMNN